MRAHSPGDDRELDAERRQYVDASDARDLLAPLIYAASGRGFFSPASDDAIKQPAMQDAWKACVAAARGALDENGDPREPLGPYVVFWAADPANSAKFGAGLDLNWPTQLDTHIVRVSGPILDRDDPKPKRLFFDSINEAAAIETDADASPGFWPRATNKPADTGVAAPPQNAVAAASVPKRLGLATCLFVLWVLSGLLLALWLWQTGGVMRNAALNFRQAAPAACVIPADQKKLSWTAACDAEWLKVWQKLYPVTEAATAPAPEVKNPPPKGEEAQDPRCKNPGCKSREAQTAKRDRYHPTQGRRLPLE